MGSLSERLRFGRRRRLKKRGDFERVFEHRLSAADGRLIVYGRPNELGYSRVGIAAGKRLGGAVRRNRYKRTLREAFRLLQHELPAGWDFVLAPRATEACSTRDYQKSLRALCRRLAERAPGKNLTTESAEDTEEEKK